MYNISLYIMFIWPFALGRARQSVRLLPISAMESGETKNVLIKVAETEGMTCTHSYSHPLTHSPPHSFTPSLPHSPTHSLIN